MAAIAPSYLTIGGLILTGQETSGVTWVTQALDGWGAVGGTISPVQKPRAAGAWAGIQYEKTRSITFTGTTDAPTAALASDAIDRLNNAITLTSTQLTIVESGITRYVNVQRDGDIHITWYSQLAFSWSVQVIALDPRKFATTLVGTTLLPASTGGAVWPEVWPEVWSATTISGSVSLTNPGNTGGPVILRIDGPCTGPQITHAGITGGTITFASTLVLGTGEWLTINMDTRQVLANDQSNRAQYITSRGWSQFDPGVNTWSFTAAAYNAASMLTVSATPAWK